jgi:glutaredoxin-like protein
MVKLVGFLKKGEESSEELKTVIEKEDGIEIEFYDFEADKEKVKELGIKMAPALAIVGDKDYGVRYYGVPKDREKKAFRNAIVIVGKGETDLKDEVKEKLKELDEDIHLRIFTTPMCTYCPKALTVAYKFAIESDRVTAEGLDAMEFQDLTGQNQVTSVPKIVLNDMVGASLQIREKEYPQAFFDMITQMKEHKHHP